MSGHSTKLKYPPKVVLKELEGMLKEVRKDKSIIFIGQLFNDKEYSRGSFNIIISRFKRKDDKEVLSLYKRIVATKKKITEIIEYHIVSNKELNPIFKMFLLKCVHKWVEAQHTLKIQKDINVKYSIEQVPKLTNPKLIDGNIVNMPIDKPNE